jgi:hypothetical protein
MNNPLALAVLIVAGILVLCFLGVFLAAGGNLRRIRIALSCEWRTLRDPDFRAKVESLLAPPAVAPETPPKPSGVPVRLLAILQREGRLVDFLLEDIEAYADAQVGAAVRSIQRQCQAALKEHLVLEPVLPQQEGSALEVTAGFDRSAIRLVGNVTGQPPFQGTLQHHGWKVREINLPPPAEGEDELILMPAEVELS